MPVPHPVDAPSGSASAAPASSAPAGSAPASSTPAAPAPTSAAASSAAASGAAPSSSRSAAALPAESGSCTPLANAEWNWFARGESELQRLDRNFLELLQELRVAQTGVQILFAFLLGMVFTPRFVELDAWQQAVYLCTLVLAASSATVLIAPVMYHRLVFRRRLKRHIVAVTHRHALVGLTFMLASLVGALTLAVSLVLGTWAIVLATVLGVTFAMVWFAIPLVHRSRAFDPDHHG